MAEFCKCGSLVINGRCTNKSCTLKRMDNVSPLSGKSSPRSAASRAAAVKPGAAVKAPPKTTRTRRASKCITYNMYDKKAEEDQGSMQ